MRGKAFITCPYCDHTFGRIPLDRSRCPSCHGTIYVFTSVLGGKKVLFTEEGYEKIVMAKPSQESHDYFTARMEELDASCRRAVASTTHYGELGRELERQVKGLLAEYLPNKYKIATGFVRSLEKPGWQSNQVDIILSRNDICHPIAVQQEYSVFPIESVVSFVEVTSRLTRAKLREDYEKVAELQRAYKRLFYLPDPPDNLKLCGAFDAPRPRFYYFAFTTEHSKEVIRQTMLDLSNEYRVQLHSMLVLKPGYCFIMPNAIPGHKKGYRELLVETNPRDAIILFIQHILLGLQTGDCIPPKAIIPFQLYYDPNFRLEQLKPVRDFTPLGDQ